MIEADTANRGTTPKPNIKYVVECSNCVTAASPDYRNFARDTAVPWPWNAMGLAHA